MTFGMFPTLDLQWIPVAAARCFQFISFQTQSNTSDEDEAALQIHLNPWSNHFVMALSLWLPHEMLVGEYAWFKETSCKSHERVCEVVSCPVNIKINSCPFSSSLWCWFYSIWHQAEYSIGQFCWPRHLFSIKLFQMHILHKSHQLNPLLAQPQVHHVETSIGSCLGVSLDE